MFVSFNIHFCEDYYSSLDPNKRQDWGKASRIPAFYGRNQELNLLNEWLLRDSCQLVTILGMGGAGKTSLSVRLAELVQDKFDCIIWRSLRDAPTVNALLSDILQFLSDEDTELPEDVSKGISQLIGYFKEVRCLVIFDNVDAVLCGGSRAGRYRPGYEDYGKLFSWIGESDHQSCLLLTTREKPKEVAYLEGDALAVRTLRIGGLNEEEGEKILKNKGLKGSAGDFSVLVKRYTGNPLALKIVATTIQDLFNGYISKFLQQEIIVFGDIRDLLDQQFERLSELEKHLMYWLAISREPVEFCELREDLVSPVPQLHLLETLESLGRRSLIEQNAACFTLQPAVMEYVTSRLIEQVCDEVVKQEFALFRSHALIKATADDYVREAQICLILCPILDTLLPLFQGKKNLEHQLHQILIQQQENSPLEPGYVGGNVLNLFNQLGTDLTNYDFSHLTIWQADLRSVNLHNTNFAGTNLSKCNFVETLGNIHSVAYSPDGTLLAAGDSNGEVHLYHAIDGRPLAIYRGHTNWVTSIAFSPDGQTLASSSSDCTVRLWHIENGQCLHTLRDHTNEVWSVSFSCNGAILATGSDDHTAKVWCVQTGNCLNTFQGHTNWVVSVVLSQDTSTLITGSDDHTVRVWDVKTAQCLSVVQAHNNGIRAIAISPNGEVLASSSDDHTIKLWNLHTGECLRTLQEHSGSVLSIAFDAKGTTLASASHDHTVKLWDINTGQCFKTLRGHSNWALSVAFHPQDDVLVSGSRDQTIRLWNVDTGQCLRTIQGYTNQVFSVAFNNIGSPILASAGRDCLVRLWDTTTGRVLGLLRGHTNWIHSVAFHTTSNLLASASGDKTIKLWDTATGQCVRTLQGHTATVWSVAFCPDSPILISGSEDHTIKVWNLDTGQMVRTLKGHDAPIWSVACNPQGTILASASLDQTVRLWDIHTGQCLQILEKHTSWVWAVTFSPDGKTLVSTSTDRTAKIWHLDRLNHKQGFRTLETGIGWLLAVAFSSDGQILASSSQDHTIKLWDVNSGHCFKTLEGHSAWIWSVTFCGESQILASSSEDETVRLWDVQTGECLRVLKAVKPYEGMNIVGATGLMDASIATLKRLGATS
ncbi:NACHT and WD40 repeat domain-containing protein [Oculatella sp. LEGE 06141]|uniref:NACHT and WD40 repeat domain-containing protein n=1 Tax=Oculatella sp. LEGE 06141 TaxID=1828648 RepID=UPI0030D8DD48